MVLAAGRTSVDSGGGETEGSEVESEYELLSGSSGGEEQEESGSSSGDGESDFSDQSEPEPEPEVELAEVVAQIDAWEDEDDALLATLHALRNTNRIHQRKLGCLQAYVSSASAANVAVRLYSESLAAAHSSQHAAERAERRIWLLNLDRSSPEWQPVTRWAVQLQALWRGWHQRAHGLEGFPRHLVLGLLRREDAIVSIQLAFRVREHRRLLAVQPQTRRWFRVLRPCVATVERVLPADAPPARDITLMEAYAECRKRGLSTYGRKDDMLVRMHCAVVCEFVPGTLLQAFAVDETTARVRWAEDLRGQLRFGHGRVWDTTETRGGWISLTNSLGEVLLREVDRIEAEAEARETRVALAVMADMWSPSTAALRDSAQIARVEDDAPELLGARQQLLGVHSVEANAAGAKVSIRPELASVRRLLQSGEDYVRLLLWLRDALDEFDEQVDFSTYMREMESRASALARVANGDGVQEAIDLLDREFKGRKQKLKGIPRESISAAVNKAANEYEPDIVVAARKALELEFPNEALQAVPLPAVFRTQKQLEQQFKQVLKDTAFESSKGGIPFGGGGKGGFIKVFMREVCGPLFGMEEKVNHTRSKSKKRSLLFTPTLANVHTFIQGKQHVCEALAVAAGVQLGTIYTYVPNEGASPPRRPDGSVSPTRGPVLRREPRHNSEVIKQFPPSMQVTPCIPTTDVTRDAEKEGEVYVARVLEPNEVLMGNLDGSTAVPGGVLAEVWLRVPAVQRFSMLRTQDGFERRMGWVCTSTSPEDGWRIQLAPATPAAPQPEPEPDLQPQPEPERSSGRDGIGGYLDGIVSYWSKLPGRVSSAAAGGDEQTQVSTASAAGMQDSASSEDFDGLTASTDAKNAEGRVDLPDATTTSPALATLTVVNSIPPVEGFADDGAEAPRVFYVQQHESVLGRHTIGGGPAVSRQHAALSLRRDETTGNSWWLKPLGHNEVFVNDRRFFASGDDEATDFVEIWSGDVIKLGRTRTLRFQTDTTAGQSNTWVELLGIIEPADSNTGDTGGSNGFARAVGSSAGQGPSRHVSDARDLVRSIVRVQSALHIEPSLSLRDTLVKAEELLQLPKTIHRTGEGAADCERIEAFAKSAGRVLKLLEARWHLLDQ